MSEQFESVALFHEFVEKYEQEGTDGPLKEACLRAIENLPLGVKVTNEHNKAIVIGGTNVVANAKSTISQSQIAQGSTQTISDQQFESLASELETLKAEILKELQTKMANEATMDNEAIKELASAAKAEEAAKAKDSNALVEAVKNFGPKTLGIVGKLALPTLGYFIKECITSLP